MSTTAKLVEACTKIDLLVRHDFMHVRDLSNVTTAQLREFVKRYETMDWGDRTKDGRRIYDQMRDELRTRDIRGDALDTACAKVDAMATPSAVADAESELEFLEKKLADYKAKGAENSPAAQEVKRKIRSIKATSVKKSDAEEKPANRHIKLVQDDLKFANEQYATASAAKDVDGISKWLKRVKDLDAELDSIRFPEKKADAVKEPKDVGDVEWYKDYGIKKLRDGSLIIERDGHVISRPRNMEQAKRDIDAVADSARADAQRLIETVKGSAGTVKVYYNPEYKEYTSKAEGSREASWNFTNDKEDAIDTARAMANDPRYFGGKKADALTEACSKMDSICAKADAEFKKGDKVWRVNSDDAYLTPDERSTTCTVKNVRGSKVDIRLPDGSSQTWDSKYLKPAPDFAR